MDLQKREFENNWTNGMGGFQRKWTLREKPLPWELWAKATYRMVTFCNREREKKIAQRKLNNVLLVLSEWNQPVLTWNPNQVFSISLFASFCVLSYLDKVFSLNISIAFWESLRFFLSFLLCRQNVFWCVVVFIARANEHSLSCQSSVVAQLNTPVCCHGYTAQNIHIFELNINLPGDFAIVLFFFVVVPLNWQEQYFGNRSTESIMFQFSSCSEIDWINLIYNLGVFSFNNWNEKIWLP